MDQREAELIKSGASELGIECSIREAYSGRGMYGSETWGVVMDDPMDVLKCAMAGLQQECIEDISEAPLFENLRTDSMGRSAIIY
jgi:hypothetical protein